MNYNRNQARKNLSDPVFYFKNKKKFFWDEMSPQKKFSKDNNN
uniref:Uncharacterized protein n=1 Tax=Meloidogyne enterolobii TaxID=390850 RepID=A0A6V7UBG7_MELEN|nr:unnamed protein product [Meloidogyne enterolobii]